MMPTESERAQKKYNYEFGGPLGSFVWVFILPLVPFLGWTALARYNADLFVPELYDVRLWPTFFAEYFVPSWKHVLMYAGWWTFQAVLYLILPGSTFTARPTQDLVWAGKSGERLQYKMNGLLSYFISIATMVAFDVTGTMEASVWAREAAPLFVVVQVWSLVLSTYLYIRGRSFPSNPYFTSTFLYDFWMGLELNPRSFGGHWDWKYFCEARPGLTGWVLLNISFAYLQFEKHGALTAPMIIACVFHFWYILDCFVVESALCDTLDVYHERFGHMLCFGDLVWVPFTYTFQAAKIVDDSPDLSTGFLVFLILLNTVGFILFRGTNYQKHWFRVHNPDVGKMRPFWKRFFKTIKTENGRLLVGGFWGIAQHLNYTGDLLMGAAWCMIAGFNRLLPYYYIIYFFLLLLHRRWRDERRCRAKYGKEWDKYTKLVPWRFVPYVW